MFNACETPTLRAMQGGSLYQFDDREANSWPTMWEADMLTTEPIQHGSQSIWICHLFGARVF